MLLGEGAGEGPQPVQMGVLDVEAVHRGGGVVRACEWGEEKRRFT